MTNPVVPALISSQPSLTSRRQLTGSQRSEDPIQKVFAGTPGTGSMHHVESQHDKKKDKKKQKTVPIDTLKNELIECCLTHMQDSYRVHLSRLKGLQILNLIITTASVDKIKSEFAMHMVWACLSCIHHFLLRLRADRGFFQWFRRRQARRAIEMYDRMVFFLVPTFYTTVFNAVITFFEEANIWDIEYFCSNLIRRIMLNIDVQNRNESIVEIISLTENSTLTNSLTARQILQVLYDILEMGNWNWMNNVLLDRFLDMYLRSLTPEESHDYNYESLEKGLETCLRSMSAHFEEKPLQVMICWMLKVVSTERIPEEKLLTFGGLLEYITNLYSTKSAKKPLSEQIWPLIFKVIGSENLLHSLLGHRILHSLIDRCKNKLKFDTPRIFLRNSHYNIVLNQYKHSDKLLFQRYREALHKTTIEAMLTHGVHKIYLENVYVSIALFMVEIPCAYTAASGVCLAMALQEAILDSKRVQMTHAHRVHATVVSLMSLICYIHKAAVFYDYVEKVVDRRAHFAPHLNPPLRMKYKYAQHHILWNKPDLFFEDWETRYGLWRCFKNRHNEVVVVHGQNL